MRNLTDFPIRREYERIKELEDKLVKIGNRIDWNIFRPKLEVNSITIPGVAGVLTSM